MSIEYYIYIKHNSNVLLQHLTDASKNLYFDFDSRDVSYERKINYLEPYKNTSIFIDRTNDMLYLYNHETCRFNSMGFKDCIVDILYIDTEYLIMRTHYGIVRYSILDKTHKHIELHHTFIIFKCYRITNSNDFNFILYNYNINIEFKAIYYVKTYFENNICYPMLISLSLNYQTSDNYLVISEYKNKVFNIYQYVNEFQLIKSIKSEDASYQLIEPFIFIKYDKIFFTIIEVIPLIDNLPKYEFVIPESCEIQKNKYVCIFKSTSKHYIYYLKNNIIYTETLTNIDVLYALNQYIIIIKKNSAIYMYDLCAKLYYKTNLNSYYENNIHKIYSGHIYINQLYKIIYYNTQLPKELCQLLSQYAVTNHIIIN